MANSTGRPAPRLERAFGARPGVQVPWEGIPEVDHRGVRWPDDLGVRSVPPSLYHGWVRAYVCLADWCRWGSAGHTTPSYSVASLVLSGTVTRRAILVAAAREWARVASEEVPRG